MPQERVQISHPGKLARQHAAELLGEILAGAAECLVSALWTVEIEKTQFSGFPAEALNIALEHTDRVPLDRKDSPGNAARLAPDLDPNPAGPKLKRVLAGRKARNFLAILDNRGTAAGRLEKP